MKMKRKTVYPIIISVFVVALALLAVQFKWFDRIEHPLFYALQPRKGTMNDAAEAKHTREQFESLVKSVRTNPTDSKAKLKLAALYIQEGRISGNYNYYN